MAKFESAIGPRDANDYEGPYLKALVKTQPKTVRSLLRLALRRRKAKRS